jgi:hypothetical protein
MKRLSIRRVLVICSVVLIVIIFVAVCPGLNFSLGSKYLGISRVSSKSGGWQACGMGVAGYGVRYEWHGNDNDSIHGPKGFSTQHGNPYFRIGNTEFYTVRGR